MLDNRPVYELLSDIYFGHVVSRNFPFLNDEGQVTLTKGGEVIQPGKENPHMKGGNFLFCYDSTEVLESMLQVMTRKRFQMSDGVYIRNVADLVKHKNSAYDLVEGAEIPRHNPNDLIWAFSNPQRRSYAIKNHLINSHPQVELEGLILRLPENFYSPNQNINSEIGTGTEAALVTTKVAGKKLGVVLGKESQYIIGGILPDFRNGGLRENRYATGFDKNTNTLNIRSDIYSLDKNGQHTLDHTGNTEMAFKRLSDSLFVPKGYTGQMLKLDQDEKITTVDGSLDKIRVTVPKGYCGDSIPPDEFTPAYAALRGMSIQRAPAGNI